MLVFIEYFTEVVDLVFEFRWGQTSEAFEFLYEMCLVIIKAVKIVLHEIVLAVLRQRLVIVLKPCNGTKVFGLTPTFSRNFMLSQRLLYPVSFFELLYGNAALVYLILRMQNSKMRSLSVLRNMASRNSRRYFIFNRSDSVFEIFSWSCLAVLPRMSVRDGFDSLFRSGAIQKTVCADWAELHLYGARGYVVLGINDRWQVANADDRYLLSDRCCHPSIFPERLLLKGITNLIRPLGTISFISSCSTRPLLSKTHIFSMNPF